MADPIKALTVPYRAGEHIVSADEAGVCLFLVQSGTVRLSRPAPGAREPLELWLLEKGDIFGERSVLDGRPYGVDAVAVSECQVLELGALTFEKMLKAHPDIGVRLLRQLAARADRLEQRLAASSAAAAPAAVEPPPAEADAADPPTGAVTPQDGIDIPVVDGTPAAKPVKTTGARAKRSTTGERAARPARACRLVQEDGPAVFALGGTEMLIGRYDPVTETQPEIDLGPLDTKRSVSRRHARLAKRDGSWYVAEESGALNGTFVNGIKLLSGRGAPLADGDVVSLGMVRLVFRES